MTEFNEFLLWEAASRDTIDFKKIYVDIAGDLNAGLMLSEIMYWHLPKQAGGSKLRVVHEGEEWIAVRRYEWWERTRLSPKEADRALKILCTCGVLVKKIFKFDGDPTIHIRLVRSKFVILWDMTIRNPPENPYLPKVENGTDQKAKRKRTKRSIPVTESTTKTTTEIKEQQQAQPASAEIAHSPLQQAGSPLASQPIPGVVALPLPPVSAPPPFPSGLTYDEPLPDQPGIYAFYVDNMRQQVTGVLKDKLVDAVKDFGEQWVQDAITEAVTHNAKTWAYIQSILDRWAKDGKGAARPSSVKGAGLPQSPAVIVKQYTEDIDPDSVVLSEVKHA